MRLSRAEGERGDGAMALLCDDSSGLNMMMIQALKVREKAFLFFGIAYDNAF